MKILSISICRVSNRPLGNNPFSLERLADIINGTIVPFEANPSELYLFDNRDYLYKKDGPEVENYFGAWNWSAFENRNDSSTDYILSRFNQNCIPLEIVEVPECNSIDELVTKLTQGIADDSS